MQKRKFTVNNKAGIHCRPSGVILNEIKKFPDHYFAIRKDGDETEITGILPLLSLGLACGVSAELVVDGDNEIEAADTIVKLLEYNFDFPPNK